MRGRNELLDISFRYNVIVVRTPNCSLTCHKHNCPLSLNFKYTLKKLFRRRSFCFVCFGYTGTYMQTYIQFNSSPCKGNKPKGFVKIDTVSLSMRVNCLNFVLRAVVFSLCLGLTIWQSYICLQKYLQFHQITEVKFVKSIEISFPAFIVCPSYPVAYNGNMLKQFGIGSSNEYRKGKWKGNSSLNEKDIFNEVTYEIEDIFEKMVIRFGDRQPN